MINSMTVLALTQSSCAKNRNPEKNIQLSYLRLLSAIVKPAPHEKDEETCERNNSSSTET